MVEMPDVNIIVALFDTTHPHHHICTQWFRSASQTGWALCPLTISGFLRVVSRPGYSPLLDVRKAANYLDSLILLYNGSYHFWEDNISLLDASLFDLGKIQGYRQLTDLHLLGIAQRNQGTLVTLDAGIASIVTAVNTPSPALLRLLAP